MDLRRPDTRYTLATGGGGALAAGRLVG